MNKRKRKKWLRQHNQYINNNELWNFDSTICQWMIPRLKRFKEINIAYPGVDEMNTFDKWQNAISKMIRAFELAKYDPIDLDEDLKPCDDYDGFYDMDKYKTIYEKWKSEVDEGLNLFAKWFSSLWI